MNDQSGHICPECGAPRESGGSPTCDCARRAADELLETRSAETAAAEDFDPLRIRPYVDLEVGEEGTAAGPGSTQPPGSESSPGTATEGRESHAGHAGGPGSSDAPASTGTPGGLARPDDWGTISIPVQRTPSAHTGPLDTPGPPATTGTTEHQDRLESPVGTGTPGAHRAHGTHESPDTSTDTFTDAFADVDATTRLTRATVPPHPVDTQLFESEPGADPQPGPQDASAAGLAAPADFPDDPVENTSSRRRRFVLVGAGATAAVVAAAGFASGLFSYESPSRNEAAPDDIRASVPDTSVDEPPSPSDSESPSESASPSSSASSSTSATPSATESTASATPSRTTATTPRASTGENEDAADTSQPPPSPPEEAEPVVLRPGDEGPEVTELQLRLRQLAIYLGNPNGDYDNTTRNAVRNYQTTRRINENQGIYDQQTRQRLESETSEP